jgi:hypothetical protein
VIEQFVIWVLERADGRRWTYCGRGEVFFDDTQIEVGGSSFEGARINYAGDLALSWQTFWWEPFLLEAQLDSPGDVSSALPAMLERHRALWKERSSDFLADSGSSAGVYLNAIGQSGFTHWSVSYNKWIAPLERLAAAQPEAVWSASRPAKWRDGSVIVEQYCRVRHQPEGCEQPQNFAVVRFKGAYEFFGIIASWCAMGTGPMPQRSSPVIGSKGTKKTKSRKCYADWTCTTRPAPN